MIFHVQCTFNLYVGTDILTYNNTFYIYCVGNKNTSYMYSVGNKNTSYMYSVGNKNTSYIYSVGNKNTSYMHSVGQGTFSVSSEKYRIIIRKYKTISTNEATIIIVIRPDKTRG
jgi:hypothetical protein